MGKDFEYPEYMFDKKDAALLHEFVEAHRDILIKKHMVIFGAGVRGSIFGVLLSKEGISEFEYCDNNKEKWGEVISGHAIISPEELSSKVADTVALISVESMDLIKVMEQQLTMMGFTKGVDLFAIPSSVYDHYMEVFTEPMQDHILILGDCRFTFVSIYDNDSDNLEVILKKEFAKRNVKAQVLTMHALCMRAQYYVLKTQLEMGNIPKTLILPINYESYNGTLHLLSCTQHPELMRRMYEVSKVKDCELEEYVKLTKERTENPPCIFSVDNDNGSPVVSDKKLKLFLKMNYMFYPSMENEGIIYLYKTFELAKEYGIKVLTFVPPINYMSGKEYWGQEFIDKYDKGIEVFKKISDEYEADMLNQSYLLKEDEFYSKYAKNELANDEGRRLMAASLLEFIEKHLGD